MLNKENHFGYIIKFDSGSHFQVDLLHNQLVRMSTAKNEELKIVSVRSTKMKLLCYLLEKAKNNIVSREELLSNVWEASSLSSSYPRLLQVVNKLKEDLQLLGVPSDFINYDRGKGYSLNCSQLLYLYFNTEEVVS
ncbi:winged helix-turn-helix domain-containing protein [Serratia sp. L9]|uniref:winged helix-turn-helix domain-containing protein n=1 Tax=Serratia sp. L9 TaxID=3423946 RepID=UPI003D66432D